MYFTAFVRCFCSYSSFFFASFWQKFNAYIHLMCKIVHAKALLGEFHTSTLCRTSANCCGCCVCVLGNVEPLQLFTMCCKFCSNWIKLFSLTSCEFVVITINMSILRHLCNSCSLFKFSFLSKMFLFRSLFTRRICLSPCKSDTFFSCTYSTRGRTFFRHTYGKVIKHSHLCRKLIVFHHHCHFVDWAFCLTCLNGKNVRVFLSLSSWNEWKRIQAIFCTFCPINFFVSNVKYVLCETTWNEFSSAINLVRFIRR